MYYMSESKMIGYLHLQLIDVHQSHQRSALLTLCVGSTCMMDGFHAPTRKVFPWHDIAICKLNKYNPLQDKSQQSTAYHCAYTFYLSRTCFLPVTGKTAQGHIQHWGIIYLWLKLSWMSSKYCFVKSWPLCWTVSCIICIRFCCYLFVLAVITVLRRFTCWNFPYTLGLPCWYWGNWMTWDNPWIYE